MKKYIYHNDGVYEIKIDEEDKKADIENYLYYDYSPTFRVCMTEEEVNSCKQGDTIEELVDCYVIIDRDNRFPMTTSKEYIEFLDYKTNKDKANFDVYGAIWVGADLKSVAKMNKEGELELL